LAVKCEYHDNFLTAQAAAAGALDREAQPCLFDRLDWLESLHRMALRGKTPACCKPKAVKRRAGCR
jgi:hypothetical protein